MLARFAADPSFAKNKNDMMKIGGLINKKYTLNKLNKNFLLNGTYLLNGRSALFLILLDIKKKYKKQLIRIKFYRIRDKCLIRFKLHAEY